jgi:hypothetical protein
VRTAFLPCLAITLLVTADPVRAQDRPIGSRVRCLDTGAAHVLGLAKAWSPSVRLLIDRVERSDLFVYVRMDGMLTKFGGQTRFITAAPGARYVMVEINPRADDTQLVSMLGHELQHVAEIADATDVRDVLGVVALLKRIGWQGSSANGFETPAALEVGRQVAREVRQAHSLH